MTRLDDQQIEAALCEMVADLEALVAQRGETYQGMRDYYVGLLARFAHGGETETAHGAARAMDFHGGFSDAMINRAAAISSALRDRAAR